jgi:hypothetical protein
MAGLFGGAPQPAPMILPPPAPTPPEPMPVPDPEAQRRAQEKILARQNAGATTRRSTIIGESDTLGA